MIRERRLTADPGTGPRTATGHRHVRLGRVFGVAALLGITLLPSQATAAPASDAAPAAHDASFTISAWRSGRLEVIEPSDNAPNLGTHDSDHVGVRDTETGQEAVFDRSMTDQGIAAAATVDFVDLSWPDIPGATGYIITRDEVPWTTVTATSIRDTDIDAGDTHQYRVDVVAAETADLTNAAQSIGIEVYIPSGTDDMASAAALIDTALAAAAAKYQYSYVNFQTFIPQSRIQSPGTAYCDYGTSYSFGGDGRSWQADAGSSRTHLTAYLTWTSAPGLMSSHKRIGPTNVYDSSGALEATKTASAANLWVKELAGTDSNQVDMRFSVQASNPFCGGSIAGAFTLTVYRGGSWVLRSGQHKLMPNWEIYIRGYSTSAWRTIYRRSYYSSYCLSRWMCSEANMTAVSGTY